MKLSLVKTVNIPFTVAASLNNSAVPLVKPLPAVTAQFELVTVLIVLAPSVKGVASVVVPATSLY